MPTTPQSGLRYPSLSDDPNVPEDILNLATDLDSRIVPRFASAASRATAITAPTEGQLTYQTDVNQIQLYNGSAWQPAPGYVLFEDVRGAGATNAGVTELVHQWMTFTAITGTKYRIEWSGAAGGSNVASAGQVRLRYQSGATLTTSGTQIRTKAMHVEAAASLQDVNLSATFTPGSGTYSVGVTTMLFSGLGTFSLDASSINNNVLTLSVAG